MAALDPSGRAVCGHPHSVFLHTLSEDMGSVSAEMVVCAAKRHLELENCE